MHPKLVKIILDNKCPFCHSTLTSNPDKTFLCCDGACQVSNFEVFTNTSSIWMSFGTPLIMMRISYLNNTIDIMTDKPHPITINAIPDDLFQSREILEQKIKLLITFS